MGDGILDLITAQAKEKPVDNMSPKREWFNTEEEYIQAHNQAEYDYGNRERMPYQVFHGGYVNPEN